MRSSSLHINQRVRRLGPVAPTPGSAPFPPFPSGPFGPLPARASFGLTPLPFPLPTSGPAARAALLEALVLVGHLALYPTGMLPERAGSEDPDRSPASGAGRPPVLLVHGFSDNRSVFLPLRRALRAAGDRRVETFDYPLSTRDPRLVARRLGERVEALRTRTGHERVDVVGHSLGGLIARYHVQCLGGDTRVRTLVTLATPHTGTRVIPLMDVHPLVRQVRPDSPLMAELSAPAPGCRTRCVAFWSAWDAVMVPASTARLEHPDLHAENIEVTGIGHLAMPVHPAVIGAVRGVLDGGPRSVSAGPARVDAGAPGPVGNAGAAGADSAA
ncbi:esterase/lipase family protein [Streptomyces sp. BI20]|uniref:esterase/lipase family protein n=1 Tax=Streptomyces sp. BI20 TaxID=3403460 RepID=UPI003C796D48